MSSSQHNCNYLDGEKDVPCSRIDHITSNIIDLHNESESATKKIKELQDTVSNLKGELQGIVVKIEQNVELFKFKITSKITVILDLLTKKQAHIQNTLDYCYNIIDNLVQTFLKIGFELENDITNISLKINDYDSELNKIKCDRGFQSSVDDATVWFINSEGRLTKRKNIVLSAALPIYKFGNRNLRRQFIMYLDEAFNAYQVPKQLWVDLASNQLVGVANDWWKMQDKNISWQQFTQSFIDWTFSDSNIRRRILPVIKEVEGLGEDDANKLKNDNKVSDLGKENSNNQLVFCEIHNEKDTSNPASDQSNTSNVEQRPKCMICEEHYPNFNCDCSFVMQKPHQNAGDNGFNSDDGLLTESTSSLNRSSKNRYMQASSRKRRFIPENTAVKNYELRKRKK